MNRLKLFIQYNNEYYIFGKIPINLKKVSTNQEDDYLDLNLIIPLQLKANRNH